MSEDNYTPPEAPIWPVTDLVEWRKECIETNRRATEIEAFFEEQKKLREQWKRDKVKRARDQEAERHRIITEQRVARLKEARLKNQTLQLTHGGSTMAKSFKKTAEVDRLIKANLGSKEEGTGSYTEGAVDRIVDEVLGLAEQNGETLDRKGLKGLVFSRRAVIAAAARKAEEAALAEGAEAAA